MTEYENLKRLEDLLKMINIESKGICINCGKPSTHVLCVDCIEASERMDQALKDGIEIEYTDGTKTTIKG